MGILDKFKKEKEKTPEYDPLNIKITDVRKGFILDYDLHSWIVIEEYKYDWGDNCFTKELKLECDNDSIFLNIDDSDQLDLSICKKVRIRNIDDELPERIIKKGKPPKKLEYDGKTFYRDSESPGYFKDMSKDDDWLEFQSWDYYDDSEKYIITIEQWDDEEFDASYGQVVNEIDFSNIIPGE